MSLPKNIFAKKVQITFVSVTAWNGQNLDIQHSDGLSLEVH